MTIDQAIVKAYLKATRKKVAVTDLDSSKYAAFLEAADSLQKEWNGEDGVWWNSRRNAAFTIATVTTAKAYDLDDSIGWLSYQNGDQAIITKSGVSYYYDIIDPSRFAQYGNTNSAMVCGVANNQLVFPANFATTDAMFGGTITAPVYLEVDDVTSGDDTVQVDDPLWLVDQLAAFYVRNDKVRQFMEDQFLADAASKMRTMKRQNNASQLREVPVDISDYVTGVSW